MNNLLLTLCGLAVCQIAIAQDETAVFASTGNEELIDIPFSSETTDESRTLELENLIKEFPKRLDYRYEKIHKIFEKSDWSAFTPEVLDLIDLSYSTNHKWEWDKNENVVGENPEAFLLNTIKDYVFMLYYTEEISLHDDIRKISNKVLDQRPNEFDFVTYFPMTYEITGEYKKALPYLERAEKLSDQNGMIMSHIAKCHFELGNFGEAMKYYKRTTEWGDAGEKEDAISQIAILNNKKSNNTTAVR